MTTRSHCQAQAHMGAGWSALWGPGYGTGFYNFDNQFYAIQSQNNLLNQMNNAILNMLNNMRWDIFGRPNRLAHSSGILPQPQENNADEFEYRNINDSYLNFIPSIQHQNRGDWEDPSSGHERDLQEDGSFGRQSLLNYRNGYDNRSFTKI